MYVIQRYLGFTDNMKKPYKTRVENVLNRSYDYYGRRMNTVNFLCITLLEGFVLRKEENPETAKNTKKTKSRKKKGTGPKTLYKLLNKAGTGCFELDRIEYAFFQYLIDNSLDTEDKMQAYDQADVNRIKEEAAEKLQQEREEKNKFDQWLAQERQNTTAKQKEITDSIFLSLYGPGAGGNYTIAACVNNFDDPRCKEIIKSRLHNENKGSIKVFEQLTGIKLPRSYKSRKAYLDELSSIDLKAIGETFYVFAKNMTWKKVCGFPIEKYGIKMFFRWEKDRWLLAPEEIGLYLTEGKHRTECLQSLQSMMDQYGVDRIKESIKQNTGRIFARIGANPRMRLTATAKEKAKTDE